MNEPYLIPLPRGMSPGFYAFMGAGCQRREDGTLLMINPRRRRPPNETHLITEKTSQHIQEPRIECSGPSLQQQSGSGWLTDYLPGK